MEIEIIEAILNDSHRKELFKKLFDLYANAMPIVIKKDNESVVCSYANEIEELAEKIREEIRLRDNQIFNAYSKPTPPNKGGEDE